VTPLTRGPDPPRSPLQAGSRWTAVFLVAAGIVFGFLLAQGTTGGLRSGETGSGDLDAARRAAASGVAVPEGTVEEVVGFSGTILASVEFGRGVVTWKGGEDPIKTRFASDASAAAYDAARDRIAVTLPEYGGEGFALHVGTLGDLRLAATGVTSFVWHPTDPDEIAWVKESAAAYSLVRATVSNEAVTPAHVAVLPGRARLVAWGSWGYALEGANGLTTVAPDGAIIATDDVQFVAAGSDGHMVVARPAGIPLSSDWAITGPDLADQLALERFDDLQEHPVAAAVLPRSGRIVLVSNRFGDGGELALIEILSADGSPQAVIRSGMIAESIAWSPDETRLAVGGYYYGPTEVRSVVLLAASDGMGEHVEVPFDHQVRPLGIRD
jgi:hypothetical protein